MDIFLLLNATHVDYDVLFKGERTTLKPGQLITGRKSIAEKLNIKEYKVQRILKMFEKCTSNCTTNDKPE